MTADKRKPRGKKAPTKNANTTGPLERAKVLIEEGKHEEAQQMLKSYREEHPADAECLRLLGNTYAYTGHLNRAIRIWREGVKQHPENVDLIYNLGLAFYLRHRYTPAVRLWTKAHGINPKDAEIVFNLGLVAKDQGKLRRAVNWWKKALELDPRNLETLNNIGVAFADLEMHGRATQWFRRAVALDPRYATGHFNLAHALLERNEFDAALRSMETAAELDADTYAQKLTDFIKTVALRRSRHDDMLSRPTPEADDR